MPNSSSNLNHYEQQLIINLHEQYGYLLLKMTDEQILQEYYAWSHNDENYGFEAWILSIR